MGTTMKIRTTTLTTLAESITKLNEGQDSRRVRRGIEELEDKTSRRIDELEDKAANFRRMFVDCDDPGSARASFYLEEERRIASKIATLQQSLTSQIAKLEERLSNTTPMTPSPISQDDQAATRI